MIIKQVQEFDMLEISEIFQGIDVSEGDTEDYDDEEEKDREEDEDYDIESAPEAPVEPQEKVPNVVLWFKDLSA